MCCPGLACLIINHHLGIAVIRADKHLTACLFHCLNRASHAAVYGLNSLYCSRNHTGMAYHIRVREVDDNHIVLIRLNGLYQLVADSRSAHFGLQVISCYLRRLHKNAILALVRLLNATVEEEGYMCVLLCLGDTNLCHIMSCQILAKGIVKLYLVESYQLVRNGCVIFGKAYIGQIQALLTGEAVELITAERSGNLSCAIRPEVEEDHRVAILNDSHRLAVLLYHCRKNKLIVHTLCVGSCDSTDAVSRLVALSLCQGVVSLFYPIPAVVAVHGVVTSHNGSHFSDADLLHLVCQLLYKILSGGGRCVTAIQEAVYIDLRKTVTLCQLQQSVDMGIVAVYAAVGYQSEQVQCGVLCFRVLHSLYKRFIFKEVSILDLLCDTGQLLIYDASRTHVHMTNLRVAHLSVRKTNCQSAGIALYKGVVLHQTVHNRSLRHRNGIALRILIQTVAIQNHQYCRFLTHCSSPPLRSLLSSSGFCSCGCCRTLR